MNLATRSARGALVLGLNNAVSIGIGFLGGVVLARVLAPNDFGTFALALTIAGLGDLRSKLQLEQKYLSDADTGAQQYNTFYALNVGLAALSSVGLLIASGVILALGRLDLALCLALISGLGLFDPLAAAIRLSLEKQVTFGRVAAIQTISNVAGFAATLTAAVLGIGLWSFMIGMAVSTLLGLGLFVRVAPLRPRLRLDRALARDFVRYGLRFGFVFATSIALLGQFDNFAIGLLRGTSELGYYDRAYRTALWPTLLFSASLGRVSLPTYALVKDNPLQLAKTFSLLLWSVLTLTTPLGIIFLLTAPDLVPALYGAKWLPSVPILQALAVFAIFRTMLDDIRSILVATGRSSLLARLMFWQAALMVALVVPLTYLYGAVGTAVAVGIAFLLSTVFLHYFGYAVLHVNMIETSFLPLLNNLLAAAGYLAVRPWLPTAGLSVWPRLAIEISTFLLIYCLISIVTSGRQIRERMKLVWTSVRGA